MCMSDGRLFELVPGERGDAREKVCFLKSARCLTLEHSVSDGGWRGRGENEVFSWERGRISMEIRSRQFVVDPCQMEDSRRRRSHGGKKVVEIFVAS